jgi:NADPH:quinone reductase-like Zn-dependent oxidoreductase
VPVQAVYPMDQVVEACRIITERKVQGKVVLSMV